MPPFADVSEKRQREGLVRIQIDPHRRNLHRRQTVLSSNQGLESKCLRTVLRLETLEPLFRLRGVDFGNAQLQQLLERNADRLAGRRISPDDVEILVEPQNQIRALLQHGLDQLLRPPRLRAGTVNQRANPASRTQLFSIFLPSPSFWFHFSLHQFIISEIPSLCSEILSDNPIKLTR